MLSLSIGKFLKNYEALKQYSLSCEFKDVINPSDGVTYPLICDQLPEEVVAEVQSNLNELMGCEVTINNIFLRMSPEDVSVPHIAHTDNSMGKYSLMLYLNDGAYTSMLCHTETGICRAPESQTYVDMMEDAQNDLWEWTIINRFGGKENMAAIFNSEYFHCAEPVGGFGKDQSDSRIVLTAFFND